MGAPIALVFAWAAVTAAPTAPPESTAVERPALRLERSQEDWPAFCRNPAARDSGDRWKCLRLGDDTWLTLAGDLRLVYEFYDQHDWGAGPQDDDGYLLERVMASADLHLGRRGRLFTEVKSGDATGRTGGPRPSQDRNDFDLNQLFGAWRFGASEAFELRVGRQELDYGDGTLLAVRELNVRRVFDGVKGRWHRGGWSVDLLAFRPAQTQPGVFDDGTDDTQALWGAWATKAVESGGFFTKVDVFALALDRRRARFVQATAAEERRTLGINLSGRRGALATFTELDLQFGHFGDRRSGRIRAWKVAQRLSWSYPERRLRPVLKLQGAVSSGDRDPHDRDLETFHPLFPRGLYYGHIDSSGSLNAIVVHPELVLTVSPAVTVEISYFSFWRQSRHDGLYSQPGFLLRTTGPSDREVGRLGEIVLRWRRGRHTVIEGLVAYYDVGAFLRKAVPPGRDQRYFGLKWQYRF